MTGTTITELGHEEGDEFTKWCADNGIFDEEGRAAAFPLWVQDSMGWDGTTFSLTEAERWWIQQAHETLEWLRLYAIGGAANRPALDAAIRCLANMRPIPNSLLAE